MPRPAPSPCSSPPYWNTAAGPGFAPKRFCNTGNTYTNIAAFQSESSADYLSAISNDLGQIKDSYLESLPYIAELVLNFIGTIALMLYYDPMLAALAVGISIFPIIASLARMQEVSVREEALSTANSRFLRVFSEALQGFRTIKSTKSEAQISGRLLEENAKASQAFGRREHTEIAVAYTASLTGHVAQIVFFLVSMILAQNDGRVSVGVIVAFVQLMRNIIQLAITMPELIARVKAAIGFPAVRSSGSPLQEASCKGLTFCFSTRSPRRSTQRPGIRSWRPSRT